MTFSSSVSSTQEMKIHLMLHARNLPNVENVFRSLHPYAKVSLRGANEPDFSEFLGRTETLKNNPNPNWTTVFTLPYQLHEKQSCMVDILSENKTREDAFIGHTTFEIGDVLGSRGSTKVKRLSRGGVVFARVTKALENSLGIFFLVLSASELKIKSRFRNVCNPFYELSAKVETIGGFEWKAVLRSPYVKKDNNSEWKWDVLSIPVEHLCSSSEDLMVKISVFEHMKKGNHILLGSYESTIEYLISGANEKRSLELKDENGKTSGSLLATQASISGISSSTLPDYTENDTLDRMRSEQLLVPSNDMPVLTNKSLRSVMFEKQTPTFLDYINGSCKLNLIVAIDFTATNGNPMEPGTPHYIGSDEEMNDYEHAICSVGSVIAKYDWDHKYPVWGFGAKINGEINHAFQVGPSAEVRGINGIIDSYRSFFDTPVVFSGPVLLTEIISKAAKNAKEDQNKAAKVGEQSFTVLLIITHGYVDDLEETKNALNEASEAPLSVIIVGVGKSGFGKMKFLDNFGETYGKRDITQFVEFEKHKDDEESLLRATLDELPDQLVSYFTARKIHPLLPMVPQLEMYDQERGRSSVENLEIARVMALV